MNKRHMTEVLSYEEDYATRPQRRINLDGGGTHRDRDGGNMYTPLLQIFSLPAPLILPLVIISHGSMFSWKATMSEQPVSLETTPFPRDMRPLMKLSGVFLLNRSPHVITSQLVRCECGFKGLAVYHRDQVWMACPVCARHKPTARWNDTWN